jgi:hypothetical protein
MLATIIILITIDVILAIVITYNTVNMYEYFLTVIILTYIILLRKLDEI